MVDWVDLKWLMLGQGHRLDLHRLQSDPAYARLCLEQAQRCPSDLLRQLAARLLAPLAAREGGVPPAAV